MANNPEDIDQVRARVRAFVADGVAGKPLTDWRQYDPNYKPYEPSLGGDLARTWGGIVSGLGRTAQDFGFTDIGRGLRDWGYARMDNNPSGLSSTGDIVRKPGRAVSEAVAGLSTLPLAMNPVALGTVLAPSIFGSVRERQDANGVDDPLRAAGAALASVGTERFLGAVPMANQLLRGHRAAGEAVDTGVNLLNRGKGV